MGGARSTRGEFSLEEVYCHSAGEEIPDGVLANSQWPPFCHMLSYFNLVPIITPYKSILILSYKPRLCLRRGFSLFMI